MTCIPEVLASGDTLKQLIAELGVFNLTIIQNGLKNKKRAQLLFEKYPKIQQAYNLSMKLYSTYQNTKNKGKAFTKLAQWYRTIEEAGITNLSTDIRTI